jgi:energy-coupling factor transport system permease protein
MTLFSLVKWDPRCKIILMACLSTLAMLRGEVWFLFGLLVFTCLLVMLGGAELSGALGQVKGLLGLIFSLFIIQCFFTRSGEPWLVIGGFTLITSGGIELACILSLRLFILAFSALLLLTGEVRDYLLALVQMKIPYEIAFMTMAQSFSSAFPATISAIIDLQSERPQAPQQGLGTRKGSRSGTALIRNLTKSLI